VSKSFSRRDVFQTQRTGKGLEVANAAAATYLADDIVTEAMGPTCVLNGQESLIETEL
jgi:hypothetical protein